MFAQRRAAVAQYLQEHDFDGIIITHLTHVRYLSGFTGSNAALWIPAHGDPRVSTDGRYTTRIAREVPDIACLLGRDCAKTLLEPVDADSRIAVEGGYLTIAAYERLQEQFPKLQFTAITGVIEDLRIHKSEAEFNALREVAEIAHTAFSDMCAAGVIRAGVSERDIAADLEYRMRLAGSLKPSFDTIVASGPNSALPHYDAGDRIIKPGDLITIDFGASANGYNSDTTRTVAVGEPSAQLREIYEVVLRAQRAGCEAAVAGTALRDVDKVCRDIITEAGYGEFFVHSTGHGVGLDVHEAPAAATTGQGILEPGHTLTIEPGIYIPEVGGVRIEDTLLITADGPENLCPLPKELQIFDV